MKRGLGLSVLFIACAVPEARFNNDGATGGRANAGGAPAGGSAGAISQGGAGGAGAAPSGEAGAASPTRSCPLTATAQARGLGHFAGVGRRLAASAGLAYYGPKSPPVLNVWTPGDTPRRCGPTLNEPAGSVFATEQALYWSTASALFTGSLETCAAARKLTNLTGTGPATDIVVSDAEVFWIERRGESEFAVRHCTGNCADAEDLRTWAGNPGSLAVDSRSLYVSWPSQGRLMRWDRVSKAWFTLARGLETPGAVAVDEDHVYLTQVRAKGTLARCPRISGSPYPDEAQLDPECDPENLAPAYQPTIEPGASEAPSIALVEDQIVWSLPGVNSLAQCSRSGCGEADPELAFEGTRPEAVTALEDCVLWVDAVDGGTLYARSLR